jgi:hypothetical protein
MDSSSIFEIDLLLLSFILIFYFVRYLYPPLKDIARDTHKRIKRAKKTNLSFGFQALNAFLTLLLTAIIGIATIRISSEQNFIAGQIAKLDQQRANNELFETRSKNLHLLYDFVVYSSTIDVKTLDQNKLSEFKSQKDDFEIQLNKAHYLFGSDIYSQLLMVSIDSGLMEFQLNTILTINSDPYLTEAQKEKSRRVAEREVDQHKKNIVSDFNQISIYVDKYFSRNESIL